MAASILLAQSQFYIIDMIIISAVKLQNKLDQLLRPL